MFLANDTPIEFGPGIHGIDEITYLYVREPGGMRIEINAGGWENYLPDWEPPVWQPQPGRDDALEEPADARLDDGVLPGRSTASRPSRREEDFRKTDLFAEKG